MESYYYICVYRKSDCVLDDKPFMIRFSSLMDALISHHLYDNFTLSSGEKVYDVKGPYYVTEVL